VALAIGVSSLAASGQAPVVPAIVINDVTVVDATGRGPLPGMTVLIADGRIADLGKGKQFKLPPGSEAIDGTGKFLIPGLWNMHVHLVGYEQAVEAFPAVLAAGVTGVRDMGSPLRDALRVREEATRRASGPRVITPGPLLVRGIPPGMKGSLMLRPVHDQDSADEAVTSLRAAGVDFIKVDGSLSRDAYVGVASAARAQQFPFAGHVPPSVSLREASDLGQRSIEHLGGPQYQLLIACSAREDELRAQISALFEQQVQSAFRGEDPEPEHQMAIFTRPILESFSEPKCHDVVSRLRKNRTWQVPTLAALRGVWNEPALTAEDRELGERIQLKQLLVVADMARSGVPLMAGTDGPLAQAGPALHDELEMLIKAGLTPMQALQSATRNPAEFMDRLRDLGTIERGKIADLVLLDADPLADIANTRRVSAVILGGWVVTRIQPQAGSGPSMVPRIQE
jgi:predicted amidohydrolase